MSGVPADLLMPNDFVTLRMGLVDEVGFDAAVLLERIRWRCEIRPEGWAATYAELSEDTRLGPRRVKSAVAVLRERGWLESENAGEGSRTLRWRVVTEGRGQTPNGQNEPMGKGPQRTDQRDVAASCSLYRENIENKTPATSAEEPVILTLIASGDEPQAALFASDEVEKPEAWPPEATVAGCQQAWTSAYEESHGRPHPGVRLPAMAAIKNLAKCCETLDDWRDLWQASRAAGHARRFAVRDYLGGEPVSRFPQRTNHHLAAAEQAARDGLLDDMISWNTRPALLGGPA